MPESKGRKPAKKSTPAQKRAAKRAQPHKRVVPRPEVPEDQIDAPPPGIQWPSRDPVRELSERFELPELPEEASYDQVLVALSRLNPLEQEVLIATRLSAMPSQKDGGMPVPIPRQVRPAWARQLRKLGLVCVPELATHELVPDPGGGMMANHTAERLRKLSTEDFWRMAKEQSPELGRLVDEADTPEKKKAAMQKLAANLPVDIQIAMQRLMTSNPDDLAPS